MTPQNVATQAQHHCPRIPLKPPGRNLPKLPLLVVMCTGNLCRSPMAEALLKHHLDAMGGRATIISRGMDCRNGVLPHPHAVQVAQQARVPLDPARRSAALSSAEVSAATVIWVMQAWQRRTLLRRYPEASGKTFLLCDDQDVPDPVDRSPRFFETVWSQIDLAVQRWGATLLASRLIATDDTKNNS
ncbi:hypothetical protein EUC41_26715 [Achromobacter denitrificans]|uniref:arsenate reductase/protein-tyrosine-phosphatase family protein n=1 Tax=Achromobacter denitrificans TaxID=32002 RepID=UPI00240E15DE|nr:hypothetical protein [Achromobacter denitrificans]WFC69590.1 hypothetical protein EUC41_26715 [Achromobacter denitrificans]